MTDYASQLIAEEEGPSSPTVYFVAGLAHIGRGICVDPKVPGAGLPAAALAVADAAKLADATALAADLLGFERCNAVQQAVLVSMCYQMGSLHGWPAFKAAIAVGDYNSAADNMLYEKPPDPKWSAWHTETPARCEREAEMLRTSVWVPK